MIKKVSMRIESLSRPSDIFLFDPPPAGYAPPEDASDSLSSFVVPARYRDDGERIFISYDEPEDSGMSGTITTISFLKDQPERITMSRSGAVRTLLTFAQGERNESVYRTPIMTFDVATVTRSVENSIEKGGRLFLHYLVALRGGDTSDTEFTLTLLPTT